MLEYFSVGKRIALYLARISPQQTIDHLVYETSLQLHEEEPGQSPLGSAHQSDGSLEFTSLLQEQQGRTMLLLLIMHRAGAVMVRIVVP